MTDRLRAAAAAVLLAGSVLLAGCSTDDVSAPLQPPPDVPVDGPRLQQLKQEAGIEPCVPGPGGNALPAVTLDCLGGGEAVDMSTLSGPLVLNLWASWCGPCKTEMPVLQEFHTKYGEQVSVLGVDFMDGNPDLALEQAKNRGVTYPQLADPNGLLREHEEFAAATGLPYLAFIDADGRILGVRLGGVKDLEELAGLVETHLGVRLA